MFVEIKQSGLSRGRAKDYFWQPFAKIKLTVLSLYLSIYLSILSVTGYPQFSPSVSSSSRNYCRLSVQLSSGREKERKRGRERSTSHFARPSYPTVCVADGIMVHLGCTCCCSSILLNPSRRSSPRTYLHVSNN